MSDDINRTSNPRCGGHFTASMTSDVAAIVDPNSGVVLLIGSRDVSDPRTDPGVRGRGPRVGSLTSRLLSDAVHSRGKDRRVVGLERGPVVGRKANALQQKSSQHDAAIVGIRRI